MQNHTDPAEDQLSRQRVIRMRERRMAYLKAHVHDGQDAATVGGYLDIRVFPTTITVSWAIGAVAHHSTTMEHAAVPLDDTTYEALLLSTIDAIHAYQPRSTQTITVVAWGWYTPQRDPEPVRRILATLDAAKRHKGLYFGAPSIETVKTWIAGFTTSCAVFGYDYRFLDDRSVQHVLEARGWPMYAVRPVYEMQAAGLSDEQIMDELLDIEHDVWRHAYGILDE